MMIGKLSHEELQTMVLDLIEPVRSDVVLRPGLGVDCGAIRIGDDICVISTDPITAAVADAGCVLVHVSCNDVAAAGAEPIGIVVTVLAPPQTELDGLRDVMRQVCETAQAMKVEVLGGHTEVTDAVNRIVLSATVLGKARGNKVYSAKDAQPGDDLVVTRWAGMEGSAIIAADHRERLAGILSEEEMQETAGLKSQLSVLCEGVMAPELGVTAMHDVTEGGVLGAVWEMATASGCGAVVDIGAIPVLPVTRKLCAALKLEPLRLVSSGCMLMAMPCGPEGVEKLGRAGIQAACIGKLCQTPGVWGQLEDVTIEIAPPGPDEIYKV